MFNLINWFSYYTEARQAEGKNYWEYIEIQLQERGNADSDSRYENNPEPQDQNSEFVVVRVAIMKIFAKVAA
jgi:hypothetical protein